MVPKKIVGELVLQLLELADAAGFFCYHLAEHHATPLGTAPSPALFLTAVAQRTLRLAKVSGCNYVICAFAWGTLPHQQTLRSLRLFASEVMPAFSGSAALAT